MTPAYSSSPLPTGDSSQPLASRWHHADKAKRFTRYLQFINVHSVPMTATDEDSEDADLFYNETMMSKRRPVRYIQRPFAFRAREEVELEEGAKASYDFYDIHRYQELLSLDEDIGFASQYDDSLQLAFSDELHLSGFSESMKYKGNLTACFGPWTFFGVSSGLVVLHHDNPWLDVELRPAMTLRVHRENAAWPYFPHSMNYIKVSRLRGRHVLICCFDDGRILLFDILESVRTKFASSMAEITMNSSVWGADSQEDILVISDNSRKVTLFYFDGCIHSGQSVELIHNIPGICIVRMSAEQVMVGCVSISGELVLLEFSIDKVSHQGESRGPLVHSMAEPYHDPHCVIRCEVKHRVHLEEQGWTVNTVHDCDFMEVHNPLYLGASHPIDTEDVLQCSKILGSASNHLKTSHLGEAATYYTVHSKTKYMDKSENEQTRLNSVTDKFSRIKKRYSEADVGHEQRGDEFLIVSTQQRLALFRSDQLVCNADTADLFDFDLREEMEFSNRLSIVHVLPWINAVVAVSQAGFFTVFRLVKHRGLHGLREEYTWPSDAKENISLFSIIGVGINRTERGCLLYVTYTSGTVKRLELKLVDDLFTMALL